MGSCSVIIVAKSGGKLLFATIESVLTQNKLTELLVVDNGNAPDVMARLQQRSLSDARLKIIPMPGKINYSKACNLASRQAVSEYLLLLKSGYLLAPNALSELVSALQNEKNAMLSTGLIQEYDGSYQPLFRNQIATPKTVFLDMIGQGRRKNIARDDAGQLGAKPFEVASIPSACMCVRASDYKKLGGLDGEFFPQDEEWDFSLRVQQIGGRVMCIPAVKITHLPSNDKSGSISQQSNEAKNTIRYLNKFFSARQVFATLFLLNMLIMLRLAFRIIINGLFEYFQETRPSYNNVKAKRLMVLALGTIDIEKTEQLAKKVILVTGATSQVGLCVIRRFIANGAAVLAVSRDDEIPYAHANLRWIKGDLGDAAFDLQGYYVDVVVHCAPLWHLPPIMELLHSAEAKRVIAYGSTDVFSNLLTANDFEKDMVLKLQNSENLVAEKCTALNIPYTIFRPTSSYGVGLDMVVTSLAKIIRRFGAILIYPPAIGRRQPVHVDDLSVAALQVVYNENSFNKSYNLSGGEALTFREMLERLFALHKKNPRIIESTALPFMLDVAGKISRKKHINGEIARRMNDDMVFFHDDATNDFGFKPRKFLVGWIKDIEGF